MYKKFILLAVLFNFISNCGFTPLYSNKTNYNFSISAIEYEGDETINNFLDINLNKFQNQKHDKKFKIKIITNYEKKIISKNKAANITNYQLSSNSIFKVIYNNNIIKEFNLTEKKIIDSNDDNFEELKDERATKQNFASSMSNKIIAELSMINDN